MYSKRSFQNGMAYDTDFGIPELQHGSDMMWYTPVVTASSNKIGETFEDPCQAQGIALVSCRMRRLDGLFHEAPIELQLD